jgi:hypothetical protein
MSPPVCSFGHRVAGPESNPAQGGAPIAVVRFHVHASSGFLGAVQSSHGREGYSGLPSQPNRGIVPDIHEFPAKRSALC